jgi:membrane-associated phospholipid phosphatase
VRVRDAARSAVLRLWQPEWGRAHPVEYGVAVTFGAGVLVVNSLPVRSATWGGNDFDDGVRDLTRIRDKDTRDTSRTVGDVLFYGLMAYPVVIDTVLVAGPQSSDVAWQMLVMNAQSLALSGFASVTLEHTTGRERPYVRECREGGDPSYAEDCRTSDDKERNQSMPSGHSAMAFTGAGLICAHHTRLPLYGSKVTDGAACVVAMTGATVQGATRLTADRHYLTDVLVGGTLGFASGYVLPTVLHYGKSARYGRSAMVMPYAAGDGVGLAALGSF